MTKAEIVNEVAKATGIEKATVQIVVEAFMESVKGSLAKGNPVYLRGPNSKTLSPFAALHTFADLDAISVWWLNIFNIAVSISCA